MTGTWIDKSLRIGLIATMIAAAAPALAHHKPGHDGGPPHAQGGGQAPTHSISISPSGVTLRLDDTVIRVVNDWFHANPQLHGSYAALPPGIARNLQRGKPLPPGIAKRFLPDGLAAVLPPPPDGYGRFIVGDDLVLIELSSGLITDIADILF